MQQKLFRNPTVKEIAEVMNLSEDKVCEIQRNIDKTLSLNCLINEEFQYELVDYLTYKKDIIGDEIERSSLEIDIFDALNYSSLTKQEKIVLINRFGLYGCEMKKLREIRDMFNGMTHEGVRLIEKKQLKK